MEHSHLMVITHAQLAINHALNAVDLKPHALNAQPVPICRVAHVSLAALVNMPLLNQLPQEHASAARKPTVRLVLHLLTPRPVPSVQMDTISLEVPARLVQTPNAQLAAQMEKLVPFVLMVMPSLNLAPAHLVKTLDVLLALLLEPHNAQFARPVIG